MMVLDESIVSQTAENLKNRAVPRIFRNFGYSEGGIEEAFPTKFNTN